jgi:hypothetical protein
LADTNASRKEGERAAAVLLKEMESRAENHNIASNGRYDSSVQDPSLIP